MAIRALGVLEIDEATQVALARGGDVRARESLYRTHAADLMRRSRFLVRDPAEAEDLVQETFAAAFTSLWRFRGEASFATWLHRIALNLARHQWRANDHVFGLFPVLGQRRTQLGGTLSVGEQQMLAMGRALMAAPKLLMLDEPSMGLAPVVVDKIFEIIELINKEGVTVFLVEQNAKRALRAAARAYVLETGTIVAAADSANMRKDAAVQKAYLGLH